MGHPGVAPFEDSSDCAPSKASYGDLRGGGSGGIGLASGPPLSSGSPSET